MGNIPSCTLAKFDALSLFVSTRPIDRLRGHLLESTVQGPSVVGVTNKKVDGEGRQRGEDEAERRERGREGGEIRPTRGIKDKPEEFSTVKLVCEERGRAGLPGGERQGRFDFLVRLAVTD